MAAASISIIGNIGGTPEIANTTSGQEILKFTVAANGRDGKVTWYRVSQFNPHRAFTDHLAKGSLVHVQGSFEPNEYQAKDGSGTRYSFDVTAFDRGINFVGGKRDEATGGGDNASSNEDVPF